MRIESLLPGERFTTEKVLRGRKIPVYKKQRPFGLCNAIHIGFVGINDPLTSFQDGAPVRVSGRIQVHRL